MRRVGLLLAVAACHRGTSHEPVDPALDLAIVVPDDFKRVEAGMSFIERSPIFATPAEFAADMAAHNQSFTIGAPTTDGTMWSVIMTSHSDVVNGDLQVWYRQVGNSLAIRCTAIHTPVPTAAERELTRKTCEGTQRVATGIYVPFQFSPGELHSMWLNLARENGPRNWTVDLELAKTVPSYTLDPKGAGGEHKQIDSGDGWFISREERPDGDHYNVVTHRQVGAFDMVCSGDNYDGEQNARVMLALCLGLEAP